MTIEGAYGIFSPHYMDFHLHEGFEINLAVGKGITYFTDSETISLEPGECVIIDSAIPHKLYIPGGAGGVYSLVLRCGSGDKMPCSEKSYHVINSSRLIYYVMVDIVNRFNADKNDETLPLCVSYLIEHLEVSQNFSLLFSVKRYINENYASLVSIKQIADYFHISSVHLQRIFRARTGETIGSYIAKKRAATAAYILETTNMSIEMIVSLVGLGSRQSLHSLIKKYYGISPQAYRKSHKLKPQPYN